MTAICPIDTDDLKILSYVKVGGQPVRRVVPVTLEPECNCIASL